MKPDLDLIEYGIELTQKLGASYSSIKTSNFEKKYFNVSNKQQSYQTNWVPGCHVRVIVNGSWGFAGSTIVDKNEISKLAHMAVKLAKINSETREKPVELVDNKPVKDQYKTPVKKDAFSIDPNEYFDLLNTSVQEALSQSKLIKKSGANITCMREFRNLGTSEGALIEQELYWTSCGITATAIKNGIIQTAGLDGNVGTGGYELIEANDLPNRGREEAKHSVKLVESKRCPVDKTTLIIEDRMLALQIHETLGHCTELDRILQTEVDYVGPIGESYFSPNKVGNMWFGSEDVNIVADATTLGGQGTFGYDDEGVPAKKTYLVKNGILVGLQSSRETAAEVGFKESSGQYLGTYGYDQPVVRMTNLNLLPGDWKREELIEDTKKGILMSGYQTEIFDQRRTTFGFGAQKAWRIENGELGEMYRDPTYYGITTPFWRTCDGVSKDNWGLAYGGGCGKCRPSQSGRVGHFCSSARFHNVNIGVSGVYE